MRFKEKKKFGEQSLLWFVRVQGVPLYIPGTSVSPASSDPTTLVIYFSSGSSFKSKKNPQAQDLSFGFFWDWYDMGKGTPPEKKTHVLARITEPSNDDYDNDGSNNCD